MKTILTTLFSVSILATMAIAGPGCSGYKEVTLAEQKSHAHEVLVVEIDGMELFQLTNQEGKIFFKIKESLRRRSGPGPRQRTACRAISQSLQSSPRKLIIPGGRFPLPRRFPNPFRNAFQSGEFYLLIILHDQPFQG